MWLPLANCGPFVSGRQMITNIDVSVIHDVIREGIAERFVFTLCKAFSDDVSVMGAIKANNEQKIPTFSQMISEASKFQIPC